MKSADELLAGGVEALGLSPGGLIGPLSAFLDELQRWSGSYNLVSFADRRELVVRHVLDSLAVHPWCDGATLLDVGSGAGFPGAPLAIAAPDCQVTLMDANGKKVRFLQHVKRTLRLPNIDPVQARVGSFSPSAPYERVVSRAFSSLSDFAGAVRHLVAPGGCALAMKGRMPAAEIEALPEWARIVSIEAIRVPHLHEERHLVIMAVTPEEAWNRP